MSTHLRNKAAGTTIRNLRMKPVSHFSLPVPPFAIQGDLAAEVQQLVSLADASEAKLPDSRVIGAAQPEAFVSTLTQKH